MAKKCVDEAILSALAAGSSASAAATAAKCSERTVRRRLLDPAFRQRVSEMRSELVEKAVGRLATIGTTAVDELFRLINNGENDNVKLGACRATLSFMLAGHTNETLSREVAELRQQVDHERNASPSRNPHAPLDPGTADGDADANPGVDPERPRDDIPPGRHETGPLAGRIDPLF
jgi:hypothetical protein